MKNIFTILTCTLFSLTLLAQTEQDFKNQNKDSNNKLAISICGVNERAVLGGNPVNALEFAIVLKLGTTLGDPNRAKLISDFLNDNHYNLICNKTSSTQFRDNEHLFKRIIALERYDYLYHLLGTEEYSVDFNAYEIIDGKKETILDYIDMILDDLEKSSKFNVDELKLLRLAFEETGYLRGEEL